MSRGRIIVIEIGKWVLFGQKLLYICYKFFFSGSSIELIISLRRVEIVILWECFLKIARVRKGSNHRENAFFGGKFFLLLSCSVKFCNFVVFLLDDCLCFNRNESSRESFSFVEFFFFFFFFYKWMEFIIFTINFGNL